MNWYMLEKAVCSQERAATQYAESQRLLREALQSRRQPATPYDLALSRLGHWLIDWGQSLQERHGESNQLATNTLARLQSPLGASQRNQDCSPAES